jgi:hypothetical protein
MWPPAPPDHACAPGPALRNVPDRCRLADRASFPAYPGALWQAETMVGARPAGRRALRPADRLRLATSAARRPALADDVALVPALGPQRRFRAHAHALAMADRERAGCDASPPAAGVDAQTARLGGSGVAWRRGYSAAKRAVGRKRHAGGHRRPSAAGRRLARRSARQPRRNRAAANLAPALAFHRAVLRRPRLRRASAASSYSPAASRPELIGFRA